MSFLNARLDCSKSARLMTEYFPAKCYPYVPQHVEKNSAPFLYQAVCSILNFEQVLTTSKNFKDIEGIAKLVS